jgi:hypothetical protein
MARALCRGYCTLQRVQSVGSGKTEGRRAGEHGERRQHEESDVPGRVKSGERGGTEGYMGKKGLMKAMWQKGGSD